MAISVAVPVGERTADQLVERLIPRVENLKIGPYTSGEDMDYGPLVTRQAKEKVVGLVQSGLDQGAELVVDGRNFNLQGYENGFFVGPHLFDRVTSNMDIYKTEIFGPGFINGARFKLRGSARTGNGPRIWKRDRHFHPRRRYRPRFRESNQYRHGGNQCADSGAARLPHLWRLEEIMFRRFKSARARRVSILHANENRYFPLAVGDQGRCRAEFRDDGLIARKLFRRSSSRNSNGGANLGDSPGGPFDEINRAKRFTASFDDSARRPARV